MTGQKLLKPCRAAARAADKKHYILARVLHRFLIDYNIDAKLTGPAYRPAHREIRNIFPALLRFFARAQKLYPRVRSSFKKPRLRKLPSFEQSFHLQRQ